MRGRLSKEQARYICYSAIYAWTGEHARKDSQFYETDDDENAARMGFNPDNPQHLAILHEYFKEIDAIIWKKLYSIMLKNPEIVKRDFRLMALLRRKKVKR